jgi:anti-sigma regulatory factor (Ser/Thr protein kinase)
VGIEIDQLHENTKLRAVKFARDEVAAKLTDKTNPDVIKDAGIIVSEAVTNAITHSENGILLIDELEDGVVIVVESDDVTARPTDTSELITTKEEIDELLQEECVAQGGLRAVANLLSEHGRGRLISEAICDENPNLCFLTRHRHGRRADLLLVNY